VDPHPLDPFGEDAEQGQVDFGIVDDDQIQLHGATFPATLAMADAPIMEPGTGADCA